VQIQINFAIFTALSTHMRSAVLLLFVVCHALPSVCPSVMMVAYEHIH